MTPEDVCAAVELYPGHWIVRWHNGWMASQPSREEAEAEAARVNERDRARQRIDYLHELCIEADVPRDDRYDAIRLRTAEAFEQLAAQYGLLKQGAA